MPLRDWRNATIDSVQTMANSSPVALASAPPIQSAPIDFARATSSGFVICGWSNWPHVATGSVLLPADFASVLRYHPHEVTALNHGGNSLPKVQVGLYTTAN